MSKKIRKKIVKSFDSFILDQVNKKIPHKRHHKYNDAYYLEMFKYMLNDVVKWKSLQCMASYKSDSEYHEYLNTIFNKWTKYNVFNDAYSEMLKKEYFKLKHIKETSTIK